MATHSEGSRRRPSRLGGFVKTTIKYLDRVYVPSETPPYDFDPHFDLKFDSSGKPVRYGEEFVHPDGTPLYLEEFSDNDDDDRKADDAEDDKLRRWLMRKAKDWGLADVDKMNEDIESWNFQTLLGWIKSKRVEICLAGYIGMTALILALWEPSSPWWPLLPLVFSVIHAALKGVKAFVADTGLFIGLIWLVVKVVQANVPTDEEILHACTEMTGDHTCAAYLGEVHEAVDRGFFDGETGVYHLMEGVTEPGRVAQVLAKTVPRPSLFDLFGAMEKLVGLNILVSFLFTLKRTKSLWEATKRVGKMRTAWASKILWELGVALGATNLSEIFQAMRQVLVTNFLPSLRATVQYLSRGVTYKALEWSTARQAALDDIDPETMVRGETLYTTLFLIGFVLVFIYHFVKVLQLRD